MIKKGLPFAAPLSKTSHRCGREFHPGGGQADARRTTYHQCKAYANLMTWVFLPYGRCATLHFPPRSFSSVSSVYTTSHMYNG
jgi:hypothetical protein